MGPKWLNHKETKKNVTIIPPRKVSLFIHSYWIPKTHLMQDACNFPSKKIALSKPAIFKVFLFHLSRHSLIVYKSLYFSNVYLIFISF